MFESQYVKSFYHVKIGYNSYLVEVGYENMMWLRE